MDRVQEAPRAYRRLGEVYWRRALAAQRESGLTQSEFCRRNGLSLATFQSWRRRLLRVAVPGAVATSTPGFVELEVETEAEVTGGYELVFADGLRLKLPPRVDGRALAEVLWALEATGLC